MWPDIDARTPDAADFPLPTVSESPYLNIADNAQYVGSAACRDCHPAETNTYQMTAHSAALSDVDPATEPPASSFVHAASGRKYEVFKSNGRMYHRESLLDADGHIIESNEFPLRYLVGSGRHSRTYLVEVDGFLLESPITWYASRQAWGMSPGYDEPDHPGFSRMVGADCLICHAGQMNAAHQQYLHLELIEQSIGCERCHGPGSLHVERRRSSKAVANDLTIVHPGDLSRPLQESICAQCHMQAAAMVRVRGRDYADFRPGLPLSDFQLHYQTDDSHDSMTVVGHFEQMHRSQCYVQSTSLTCTTCHAMHEPPPEDKITYYKQKCLACHSSDNCGLELTERQEHQPEDNCVACHMPTSDTDIPHIAFTHHRIGIHRPSDHPTSVNGALTPLHDVSHLSKIEQHRALGLAYLKLSEGEVTKNTANVARQQAREHLTSSYDDGLQDGETLAALANLFYGMNNEVAEDLASRAIITEGLSDAATADSLFLLADLAFDRRQYKTAIPYLERAVKLRRMYEDWLLLGLCYLELGQPDQAELAFTQARAILPFRPEINGLLARCERAAGDNQQADIYAAKQVQLQSAMSPKQSAPDNSTSSP